MLFVSSPIPAIFYFKKGGQRQSKTKWDGSSSFRSLAIFRKLVILSKVRRQYLLISLSLYLWLHEEAVTSEAHFNTLAINANYGGSFNHWYYFIVLSSSKNSISLQSEAKWIIIINPLCWLIIVECPSQLNFAWITIAHIMSCNNNSISSEAKAKSSNMISSHSYICIDHQAFSVLPYKRI